MQLFFSGTDFLEDAVSVGVPRRHSKRRVAFEGGVGSQVLTQRDRLLQLGGDHRRRRTRQSVACRNKRGLPGCSTKRSAARLLVADGRRVSCSGYEPSHTWEGYRGHGRCSSAAAISGALRLQAEDLQRVFGCVHFSFFHRRTQLSRSEGMSGETQQQTHVDQKQPTSLNQATYSD